MSRKVDGEDRERKLRRVREVAAGEFARHGFTGANINTIAELAGLGKGTIYLYAENKEQLMLDVLTEMGDRLRAALDNALATSGVQSPEGRLRAIAESFTELARTSPDFMRLQASTLFGVNRRFQPKAAEILRDVVADLASAFDADVLALRWPGVTPEMLALVILGSLQVVPLIASALDMPVPESPSLASVLVELVVARLPSAVPKCDGDDARTDRDVQCADMAPR